MIVVFDMDECIASLSKPCNEYHSYIENNQKIPKQFIIKFQRKLKTHYLRPGIDEFILLLQDYKIRHAKNNDSYDIVFPIQSIVLMTNASNEYNWVEFVVSQIEYVLGAKEKIFDLLLSRNSTLRKQVPCDKFYKYGGLQPKFMKDVIKSLGVKNSQSIIMYDDHDVHLVPAKGHKNYMTKVPPYHEKDREYHDRFTTFSTFLPPLLKAMNYFQ